MPDNERHKRVFVEQDKTHGSREANTVLVTGNCLSTKIRLLRSLGQFNPSKLFSPWIVQQFSIVLLCRKVN